MTILELAESFKMMNRPGPTVTLFTDYFLKTIKYKDVKFWRNLHSSLQFVLSKCGIYMSDSFKTMRV